MTGGGASRAEQAAVRLIKRYAGVRFYDVDAASYVSIEEVADLLRHARASRWWMRQPARMSLVPYWPRSPIAAIEPCNTRAASFPCGSGRRQL